jgi:Putative prokaryotic signal transducing protein
MSSSSSSSGGRLVRVALVQNEMEAEMIRGLLTDNGIPSMVRRMTGFGDWTLTSAGPQEVVVPEAAVEKAREIIADAPGSD